MINENQNLQAAEDEVFKLIDMTKPRQRFRTFPESATKQDWEESEMGLDILVKLQNLGSAQRKEN